MKILASTAFALTAALLVAASAAQEPEVARPSGGHAWLQHLVGEWSIVAESRMTPDAEPSRHESTETVRQIGELWIVSEQSAEFAGMPFSSLMTLGYDPEREVFIGSWIDSSSSYFWNYVGTLDESGKVLTLETEGPSITEPGKRLAYRDVHTLVGPGHRTMHSMMKAEDGSWTTFMNGEARLED